MSGEGGQRGRRVLIAGVGNIFLGDDGFGSHVAQRLSSMDLPEGVRVADYGISGMHLAYDIAEGYDTIIVVDAALAGGEPGAIVVTEVDATAQPAATPLFDAHGMQPHVVFGMLNMLGTRPGRIIVVGCQPGSSGYHIGLSEPVEAAVGRAVQAVMDLLAETSPGPLSRRHPGPAPPAAAQCGHGHAPGERMRAGGPGQPSRGQLR